MTSHTPDPVQAAPVGAGMNRGWRPALACALAGAALFQFFGNANHGYIDTSSLFHWWGYQWWNPGSETEHGWLILALSGWLLWRNLRQVEGQESRVESRNPKSETLDSGLSTLDCIWPAFAAMAGGLALHAVGFAVQQARISVVALLFFIWGVLALGGGRRWRRASAFPLTFMAFAIPLNVLDSVGFWLRMGVSSASAGLAHAAGIGVLQNGTQLLAPDGRYQYDVAAACSGVNSLMALAALSLLMGYLTFRPWWLRGLVLLLCGPFAYLGNLARISSIIFAAQWGGQWWGDAAHTVMGYGVFVIVLGGELAAVGLLRRFVRPAWLVEDGERKTEDGGRKTEDGVQGTGDRGPSFVRASVVAGAMADKSAGKQGTLLRQGYGGQAGDGGRVARSYVLMVVVVLLAVGEMAVLAKLGGQPLRGDAGVRLSSGGRDPVELPAFLGTEWIGRPAEVSAVEREILPPDTGFSRKSYVAFADPTRQVFLSLVLSGRDRTSIHRPELCLVGQGWTIENASLHRFAARGLTGANGFPATVLHVRREVMTPGGRVIVPQLVAYWFVSSDAVVATHWQRFAHDAWNRLRHLRADRWAYVLMQTDARDGEAAALARMQAVLDRTLPVFQPPQGGAR